LSFPNGLSGTLDYNNCTIDGINQGAAFPPRHDRTHVINLVANIDWKNLQRRWRGESPVFHKSNWQFGITLVYSSGQPITVPGSGYFINTFPDREVEQYEIFPSVINDLRLPPYARLVSASPTSGISKGGPFSRICRFSIWATARMCGLCNTTMKTWQRISMKCT